MKHIKSCLIYIKLLFDMFSHFTGNPFLGDEDRQGSVEHSLKMKVSCRDSAAGKCSQTEV